MNRKTIYLIVWFSLLAILFLCAYLTHITWLWVAAVGLFGIPALIILRRMANAILDENNGEKKRGKLFMLPRPSGLGSQAGSTSIGGSSNFFLIKQEHNEGEPAGETHAYLPESALASDSTKGEKEEDAQDDRAGN